MIVATGTRLGVYEITAPIGEGGMGQVFLATDTKLKRQVAIKVLPPAVANDPDRLARFQREAEVLASLNQPSVAHIYGLDRQEGRDGQDGTTFIVMEFVDGEDLSQRIARGPIPLDEALPIAKQIVDALGAAHGQGIVHRDLKPANIKVRADGTVKVLDFGLAKAVEREASAARASMHPTITTPAMTQAGMILGTAAYMSPEQAKGRVVDKRSDVWAFGCVLFEMLTGRRAFEGEDVTDTIAAVVRGEPDWTALPNNVPDQIRLLIKRCLEKDLKARIADIGVARFLLTETLPTPQTGLTRLGPVRPSLWKRAAPIAATALVSAAVVGGAAWMLRPQARVPPVARFTLTLAEGQQFTNANTQSLGISPDGTRIAFVANRQIHLRALSDLEARPIAGTLQAAESGPPNSPVFSPDGQSIAYASPTERAIKKIAVNGGAPFTVCSPELAPSGLTWDGGDIIFGQGSKGLFRVSANGGQPAAIAPVKSGEIAASPQMLPGGEWVLFTVTTSQTSEGWDKAQIVVQSLKTSERKTLVSGGSDGRYVASGHIVYALGGVLFAAPFDLRHLAVTGAAVPVVEGVRRSNTGISGTAYFGVSANGSLIFIAGPVAASGGQNDLGFSDRATGTAQPLKLPPAKYEHPRLSPDGKWIAVGSDDGKDAIVWIADVSGAASIRRLTLGGRNRFPVWSADGQYVTYQSDREGDRGIWRQRADGSAPAERLTKPEADTAHLPESWSPDGRTLLFSVGKGAVFTLAAFSMPEKTVTPFGTMHSSILFSAAFSPDGKWVAYEAKEGGTVPNPLFVQTFPPTGATYQITGNGIHATWSRDGKQLYYLPAQAQVVGVSITTKPAFAFGNPVAVPVRFDDRGPAIERNNDITPDGTKFLGVLSAAAGDTSATTRQIQVVLNWFEELKQRVPAR